MKKIYNYILLLILFINFVKSININAIVLEVDDKGEFIKLSNDFNEYSVQNNLDIKLNIVAISSDNSTLSNGDRATIQTLLQNKSKKYDIYFYIVTHAPEFCEYLMDLKGHISPDILKMYYSDTFNRTCIIDNRLIGMPVKRAFSSLYYNIDLLKKYKMDRPKTWEQLISMANYIYDEEVKLNSTTTLHKLDTLYGDDEEGSNTMYEVLYSYRRTYESYYPDLRSKEALEATEMLGKIKEIGLTGHRNLINDLKSGNTIFARYWAYVDKYKLYKLAPLPGWKDGISAATLGGTDVGIGDHIEPKKKEAALKVIEFILSREEQKSMIIEKQLFSGIKELFHDPDVCEAIDCELYANIQETTRYHHERKDYVEYSSKFRTIMREYMFGNITAKDALKRIDNLSRIQEISISTENSFFGLIYFILNVFFIVIVLISFMFVDVKRFEHNFKFLPKNFWYIVLIGLVCSISANFTSYGEILISKYRLRVFLYSIGFTLTFVPVLYKLLSNFPEENKISKWISDHKYTVLLTFVGIDIFLNLINLASSYKIKTIESGDKKLYQECLVNGFLAKSTAILICIYKVIVILAIILLNFFEWSIEETLLDLRYLTTAIYLDIISIILIIVVKCVKFSNYNITDILNKTFIYMFILSNYLFIFGIRIIYGLFIKKKSDEFKISKYKTSTNATSTIQSQRSKSSGEKSSINKYKKIISYHYQTQVGSVSRFSSSNVGNITATSLASTKQQTSVV